MVEGDGLAGHRRFAGMTDVLPGDACFLKVDVRLDPAEVILLVVATALVLANVILGLEVLFTIPKPRARL